MALRSISAALLRPSLRAQRRTQLAAAPRRFFHSSGACAGESHQPLASHEDRDGDNKETTPFDFTETNYGTVRRILARYPTNYKASAIIPLLDLAQRQNANWLTLSAMHKVAQITGTQNMDVYEVATFYTMFNRNKVGKYLIQLCGTTPCMLCGAVDIRSTIENHLGIKCGEMTKDGMFTLLEVECLGACSNAPMFQLNDDFYENLTPESTVQILDACYTDAGPPKMKAHGSRPMNHQVSCEGPQGKTTLTGTPSGPFCRDLDAEREKLEAAKNKK